MDFKTKPFPYQEKIINDSFRFLMESGFAFYDMDVGTGKTKSSLNTAELLIDCKRIDCIMIICPKPLMRTWQDEIEKHTFINWPVYVWKKANLNKYLNFSTPTICILNIESFSTKNEQLQQLMEAKCKKGTFVILDESSKIKNHGAERTKHLIKLTQNAGFKACLTGTKITNSLLDIFTQFEFLKKDFWNIPWGKTLSQKYYMFRNKHAVLEEKYGKGRTFKVVTGYKAIDKLLDQIKPYTVTARKEDCLKDLPEKTYQVIKLTMNDQQAKIYKDLKDTLMAEYEGQTLTVALKMTLFTRFRQITGGFMPETGTEIKGGNPKIEAILSESDSIEKAIVWSCFKADIEALVKELSNDEFYALSYYGEVSQIKRDANIILFKDDPKCKYLICNPASAAFGLNLQFSNVSYFYNRPLSVEQNIQAEGRQHRSGQKTAVIYKDLVCQDTIDERVLKMLQNKQDLITMVNSMTIGDIYNLV